MKLFFSILLFIFLHSFFCCSNAHLKGQSVSFQKAFISEDSTTLFTQSVSPNEVIFSQKHQSGGYEEMVRILRGNVTKSDVMWDVFQKKLYYVHFYTFIENVKEGLFASHETTRNRIEHSRFDIEKPNYSIYTSPPPLANNIIQAIYPDKKKPETF